MQIQINTDHNIEGREALATHVRSVVEGALKRFGEHISRVEVHLSDENAGKSGGHDKRCVIEVRLRGRPPVAVTQTGETLHQAIDRASEKAARAVDSTLGRAAEMVNPAPPSAGEEA